MSDFGMQVFRICVAESDRFPELGREFYRSGPLLVRQRLTDYLSAAVSQGKLVVDDLDLAADQLTELCKANIHGQMMFGAKPCCSPRDVDRTVNSAVEMFMARYGVKG